MPAIQFNLDMTKIEQDVQKLVDNVAKEIVDRQLRAMFRNRDFGQTPGPAFQLITESVDGAILTDKFQQQVDAYVQNNWERVLNEACEKALQHKANAIAFNGVKR